MIGVATFNIIDLYRMDGGEYLISSLIWVFMLTAILLLFNNIMFEKKAIKIALKAGYKRGNHEVIEGKYTCDFNNEYFKINNETVKWTEFSKVDTDEVYVFMYLNNLENVVMFPKFPKDLPIEERDKLNEIIQSRFNVNIRL